MVFIVQLPTLYAYPTFALHTDSVFIIQTGCSINDLVRKFGIQGPVVCRTQQATRLPICNGNIMSSNKCIYEAFYITYKATQFLLRVVHVPNKIICLIITKNLPSVLIILYCTCIQQFPINVFVETKYL